MRASFRRGLPDYRFIAAGCRIPVLNIVAAVSEVGAATAPVICQIAALASIFAVKIRVFTESNDT